MISYVVTENEIMFVDSKNTKELDKIGVVCSTYAEANKLFEQKANIKTFYELVEEIDKIENDYTTLGIFSTKEKVEKAKEIAKNSYYYGNLIILQHQIDALTLGDRKICME